MADYATVSCAEEQGSVQEGGNRDGLNASVTLRVAWASRWALMEELVGDRKVWPHGPSTLKCVSASSQAVVAGDGVTSGQTIAYVHALVTAQYTTRDVQDVASESIEPTVEFMTLDHKDFRWGAKTGEPLKEGEAPGKLVRGLNLVRTLYDVGDSLPVSLLTLPGSVNDGPYTSALLGITFPTESLLFGAPSLQTTYKVNGTAKRNLTLKFTVKAQGWNKFWRAKNQQWLRIHHYLSDTPYYNYPLDSFSDFLA